MSSTKPGRADLIALDGSSGEGGGQILRSALALAALTGRAFRITRIRANRSQPGLRPQHLAAVEAAARVCGADLTGASVGSSDLIFRPGPIAARDLSIDIGTAGATSLVLQTIALPLALRAESAVRVTLTGGTFNVAAPSYPFLAETWRATWQLLGLPVMLSMPKAGHFPKGGGVLEAWIEPGRPTPLVLEDRGRLVGIRGVAETTGLPGGIRERMAARAEQALLDAGHEADITVLDRPGPGQGAAISLVADFEHGPPATFVGLGRRGLPAEAVAEDAVAQLVDHLDAPHGALDVHNADQILLPLAFAEGRSVYTVTHATEHLRTNVRTLRAFLDRPIRLEEAAEFPGGRVILG